MLVGASRYALLKHYPELKFRIKKTPKHQCLQNCDGTLSVLRAYLLIFCKETVCFGGRTMVNVKQLAVRKKHAHCHYRFDSLTLTYIFSNNPSI